jgi:DNA-binding MarR family transcriptional regulator
MPSTTELRLVVMRLARLIRAERAEGEVADNQRSVLFFLFDNGAQSLGAVADNDRVTPPSMNRTINALLERGYVTRVTSVDDGRKVSIDLTDAGRTFVKVTRRKRDAWFAARLAKLTSEERAILEAAGPVLLKLTQK